jgi:hypothetical protein
LLVANKNDADSILAGGKDRALDLRPGRFIRTHRVQGDDAWHGGYKLAGFLNFEDFATFVIATLGAGAMWHLALVAIRTLRERVAFQGIVRAPGAGALFRVSPFWIRHSGVLL